MVARIRLLLETRQLTPTQFADAIGVARPIVSHILSGRNKPSLEVVQRILAAMPDLSMPWLLNGTGPMLATAVVPAAAQKDQTAATAVITEVPSAAYGAKIAPQEPASPTRKTQRPTTPAATANLLDVSQNFGPNRQVPKRFTAPISAKSDATDGAGVELAAPVTMPKPAQAPVTPTAPFPQPPEVTNSPEPVEAAPTATEPAPPTTANNSRIVSVASALAVGGEKPIRRIVIFYRDGSFADYQPE